MSAAVETDSSECWRGCESNLTHVTQALDLILIIHSHIVNHESSTDKPLLSHSLSFFTASKCSVTFKEDFQKNMTGVSEKDLLNQDALFLFVFNGLMTGNCDSTFIKTHLYGFFIHHAV